MTAREVEVRAQEGVEHQCWGGGEGVWPKQATEEDVGTSILDGVPKRNEAVKHLWQVRRSPSEAVGPRLDLQPAPLTSCLLLDSGLGGQVSLVVASWVRKEEKSHILWWLYPLGSLPETLATEQTVGLSGGRGRELGACLPSPDKAGDQRTGELSRGALWPLMVNSDPRVGGGSPKRRAWELVTL